MKLKFQVWVSFSKFVGVKDSDEAEIFAILRKGLRGMHLIPCH